ncbi:tRNA synthetases class II-domain-containing protein [Dipodascopsis tothii]|uniref:tRNA synthetases class II-domain-containing protein n=1 Tax=Dipodascopsis tothii TaxID=44089 RepID=UPI0034CFF3AD
MIGSGVLRPVFRRHLRSSGRVNGSKSFTSQAGGRSTKIASNAAQRPALGLHPSGPFARKLLVPYRRASSRAGAYTPDLGVLTRKFQFPKATCEASAIQQRLQDYIGQTVTLHGWIRDKPRARSKRLCFADLRDTSGTVVQLVETADASPLQLAKLRIEAAVCVTGIVQAVEASDRHDRTWDLQVLDVQVLNESSPVVSQLGNPKDWPGQYRYLQLRTQDRLRNALKLRSQTAAIVRNTLAGTENFTEVETPLLFKSTPEGADEFLVPTRTKGRVFALPQSPQQYKQLLMASGVHRYFQIAKCFRDEDLRQDRQPEFTQIDLEMAFAGADDVQAVVERLVQSIWTGIVGAPLSASPIQRLSYADVMTHYGIDKPDLTFNLPIERLDTVAGEHPDYPVLEALVVRPAELPELVSFELDPESFKDRVPIRIDITADNAESWLGDAAARFKAAAPTSGPAVAPGDTVYISTRQTFSFENPTPLGRLRKQLIDHATAGAVDLTAVAALWVVDFPLFTPAERPRAEQTVQGYPEFDYAVATATHHPFTMPNMADVAALFPGEPGPDGRVRIDMAKIRGQHYDLVINGVEVGGGSARVHDPDLQRYIFSAVLGIDVDSPASPFTHLLDAFATGCPPHAGLAIGFDRLVAMLAGTKSIRDVIAFPKSVTGADLVVKSPTKVTEAQLQKYHLRVR